MRRLFGIRLWQRCLQEHYQLRRTDRLPLARDTLSVFCLYTELSTSFWMMDELTLVVRKRYHHDPSHPEQSEYRQPRASHGQFFTRLFYHTFLGYTMCWNMVMKELPSVRAQVRSNV